MSDQPANEDLIDISARLARRLTHLQWKSLHTHTQVELEMLLFRFKWLYFYCIEPGIYSCLISIAQAFPLLATESCKLQVIFRMLSLTFTAMIRPLGTCCILSTTPYAPRPSSEICSRSSAFTSKFCSRGSDTSQ